MRGSVDEPEMVAGVVQGGPSVPWQKGGCGDMHLAQILLSERRFVLFSYTRISYPFCGKFIVRLI